MDKETVTLCRGNKRFFRRVPTDYEEFKKYITKEIGEKYVDLFEKKYTKKYEGSVTQSVLKNQVDLQNAFDCKDYKEIILKPLPNKFFQVLFWKKFQMRCKEYLNKKKCQKEILNIKVYNQMKEMFIMKKYQEKEEWETENRIINDFQQLPSFPELNFYKPKIIKVKEKPSKKKYDYIHKGVKCNSCGVEDIKGYRYQCTFCLKESKDYHLCKECKDKLVKGKETFHPHHYFAKILTNEIYAKEFSEYIKDEASNSVSRSRSRKAGGKKKTTSQNESQIASGDEQKSVLSIKDKKTSKNESQNASGDEQKSNLSAKDKNSASQNNSQIGGDEQKSVYLGKGKDSTSLNNSQNNFVDNPFVSQNSFSKFSGGPLNFRTGIPSRGIINFEDGKKIFTKRITISQPSFEIKFDLPNKDSEDVNITDVTQKSKIEVEAEVDQISKSKFIFRVKGEDKLTPSKSRSYEKSYKVSLFEKKNPSNILKEEKIKVFIYIDN